MRFSDIGIRQKLYLGFGSVMMIVTILLVTAYTNFNRLSQANALNEHTYQVITESQYILESLLNMETGARGFALVGEDASLAPLKKGEVDFKNHLEATRKLTADNPAQQQRLKELEQMQADWYSKAIAPSLDLRRKVADGASIDTVLGFERDSKGRAGMDKMRVLLAAISKEEENLLVLRAEDANRLQSLTANTLLFGGLLTLVLAALLAWRLSHRIVMPLREALNVARTVASGDLTSHIRPNGNDEIGKMLLALGEMNQSLVNIVGEVRSGTDTIATASEEIARGNMDLSERTEHQASSLEETASSMETLTDTVRQNADNARQANVLAVSASQVALRGGEVVSQVVDTMSSINASSKNIVDIIGVIDSIAFQTNILALNAAVEAARAGEQGRGFAVVASEVRNLAQRSAGAAKEIKSLITDTVDRVEAGSKLVQQAGVTMTEIVDSVRHVTDIMQEITSASHEQISGIEQINQAISQMDGVTQQNAALVEQAAAAAGALQEQASHQAEIVSVFKLDENDLPANLRSARKAAPARAAATAPAPTPKPVIKAAPAKARPAPVRLSQPAKAKPAASAATSSEDGWEEF